MWNLIGYLIQWGKVISPIVCERDKMKKFIARQFLVVIMLFSLLALLGCSKEADIENSVENIGEVPKEIDLSDKTWKEVSNGSEGNEWNVIRYWEDICTLKDGEWIKGEALYATNDQLLYCMQEYHKAGEGQITYENVLHVLDVTSLEERKLVLALGSGKNESNLTQEELENIDTALHMGKARVNSLDAVDGIIVLTVAIYDDDMTMKTFYVIKMTEEGSIIQGMDMLKICQKDMEGITTAPTLILDADENVYVVDNGRKMLYILDMEGQKLSEIYGNANTITSFAGKSVTGVPIFFEITLPDMESQFFCLKDRKRENLSEKKRRNLQNCWVDWSGRAYYVTTDSLYKWNVLTGEVLKICNLNGIKFTDVKQVITDKNGDACLFVDDGTESDCLLVSEKVLPDAKEVIIMVWGMDDYVTNCVSDYERKHPGIHVKLEPMNETNELAMNRLAEEIRNGNGPDLLILRRKELEILQGANCLRQIDGILSEELKTTLFAGALKYGEIDGHAYGIPYEAEIATLLISDQNCESVSWSLRDAMDLCAKISRENKALIGIESTPYPVPSSQLLVDLLLCHMEGSHFLDIKNGKCDFENKEFEELLAFCKQYGDPIESQYFLETEEKLERVHDGSRLTDYVSGGFLKYSHERSLLGERFHAIGFPSIGTRMICNKCVAISNMTKNPLITEDIVLYLLSPKCQTNYSVNWLRKDIMLSRVKEHTDLSEKPVFLMDGYNFIELDGKGDGTSFLQEYVELMENAKVDMGIGEVQNIILEEAEAFFTGDKTLEEVVRVIQSRVQLYFDE